MEKSKIWNSVELCEEYKTNGGALQTRKYLLRLLKDYFAGELLILNCSGYASILTFKASKTSHILLVKDLEEDQDLDHSINVVANHVVKETLAIPIDRSEYSEVKMSELQQIVSDTLLRLLSSISNDLGDECLPALMIEHIVTSVLKHQSTILQLAFGILLRSFKKILGYLYNFGITCSHDEARRFKKSAAVAATDKSIIQEGREIDGYKCFCGKTSQHDAWSSCCSCSYRVWYSGSGSWHWQIDSSPGTSKWQVLSFSYRGYPQHWGWNLSASRCLCKSLLCSVKV